jgi:predicted AAA+ superfamily ATPase
MKKYFNKQYFVIHAARQSGKTTLLQQLVAEIQNSIKQGLSQLSKYMDTLGEKTGWLILFDRNKEKLWEKKISWNTEEVNGMTIQVVGC